MSSSTEITHWVTTAEGLVGLPSGRWWIDISSARRMVGSADAVNAAARRGLLRAASVNGRKVIDFPDLASRWLLHRPDGSNHVRRYVEQFERLRGGAAAVMIVYHDDEQFEAFRLANDIEIIDR